MVSRADFEALANENIESGDPERAARGRFIRDVMIPFGVWWEAECKESGLEAAANVAGGGLVQLFNMSPGTVLGFTLEWD